LRRKLAQAPCNRLPHGYWQIGGRLGRQLPAFRRPDQLLLVLKEAYHLLCEEGITATAGIQILRQVSGAAALEPLGKEEREFVFCQRSKREQARPGSSLQFAHQLRE